ncbi:transposase family protein [Arhodomonas sp. SL1]|uniref:transposase family protein n=1 Tax=Arhodomonas sp. SL1 TaxID=3425691 RepID=UPI003F885394
MADQPVHDSRRRSWQHLHLFGHRAYVHASVPRVRCSSCRKTTQVAVPWARRCRLAPFKRLALTIKAHWEGVLNAVDRTCTTAASRPPTDLSRPPRPTPAAIAARAT